MPTAEDSVEQQSDELHDEVTMAALLALYFHKEDEILGSRLSARTFDLVEYYFNHRRVLYDLLIEASVLNTYLQVERERLTKVIDEAIGNGIDVSIKVLEQFTRVQEQAELAVKRLEDIDQIITSGDWRLLDAGQS
jgi:hypothetical protein